MKYPVYNKDWSKLVQAVYEHDLQEMWEPSRLPHIYNCYHEELRRYMRLAGNEPLRILDVGCAQGTLALLLAETGHRVTAVDLRQEFLDYARTRYEHGKIEFVQGNALELAFDESFDLIFANQILEHLVYPVVLIQGLAGLLRPGGRIVCTTPSAAYIKSNLPTFRELGDVSFYEDRQFFPDGDEHFFAYSPDELQDIFSAAGLDSVNVFPYSSPWITGHIKMRFLHGRVPVRLLALIDRVLLSVPGLRWKWGYQLMATGVKTG